MGEVPTKISKFILTKKVYEKLTIIFVTRVWSDPKVNPQFEKNLNP